MYFTKTSHVVRFLKNFIVFQFVNSFCKLQFTYKFAQILYKQNINITFNFLPFSNCHHVKVNILLNRNRAVLKAAIILATIFRKALLNLPCVQ